MPRPDTLPAAKPRLPPMPSPASLLHAPKPASRHRRQRAWRLGQGLLVGGAAGAGLCLVPAVHTLTGPLQRWAGDQAWPSLWAHSPRAAAGLAVSGLVLSLLALRAGRALLGPAPTAAAAAPQSIAAVGPTATGPSTDSATSAGPNAASRTVAIDGAAAAACLAQSPVPLLLLQAPPSAQVLQMNLALRHLLGLPTPAHPAGLMDWADPQRPPSTLNLRCASAQTQAFIPPAEPAPAWPATGLHRWLSPADGAAFSALLQQLQGRDAPPAPRTLHLLRPGQPPLAVDLQAGVVRAADGLPLHTVVQIVPQPQPAARPPNAAAAPAAHQAPLTRPTTTGRNARAPHPPAALQPD